MTTADAEAFGDAWIYCRQHLRPHKTGWCTVNNDQKVPLEATSMEDAYAECNRRGFEIFDARIAHARCLNPFWSDAACGHCDGCRSGRENARRVMSAAQMAVAAYDNDHSLLEQAMHDLRLALDRKEKDA